MSRLYEKYKTEIIPELQSELGIKNKMAVPRLEKIVLNMGAGDAIQNIKLLDAAKVELGQIAGQLPVIGRARKSISAFKLRKGQAIACFVTLRSKRMYEFYDRLVSVAIPRIRDFRGLPQRSFDGQGNYTFGVQEQIIFPEINYDKVEKVRGMDITFVTSAPNDEQGLELLKLMRFPFRER